MDRPSRLLWQAAEREFPPRGRRSLDARFNTTITTKDDSLVTDR